MLAAVETCDASPKGANPAPNEECRDGGDNTNQKWTAQFHDGRLLGEQAVESWHQFTFEAIATAYGPGS